MAKFIEAIRRYGPRLKLNSTVPLRELAHWISMRTSLNENEVLMVLQELKAAILYFNCLGTPVKLPGLGRFSPSIAVNGTYRINLRLDSELRDRINFPKAFSGRIENRGNVGIAKEDLKSLWDAENPSDPLEL